MIWLKLLDLALIALPALIELFQGNRQKGENARDYVRRKQAEKLKTTELILKENGEELSRLSHNRLLLTRELLKRAARVRDQSSKPPTG